MYATKQSLEVNVVLHLMLLILSPLEFRLFRPGRSNAVLSHTQCPLPRYSRVLARFYTAAIFPNQLSIADVVASPTGLRWWTGLWSRAAAADDDDDNPVKGSVRTFTLARRRVSPTEHPSEPAVFVLDSGYAGRFPRVETLVTHPSSNLSVAVQRKVQV